MRNLGYVKTNNHLGILLKSKDNNHVNSNISWLFLDNKNTIGAVRYVTCVRLFMNYMAS